MFIVNFIRSIITAPDKLPETRVDVWHQSMIIAEYPMHIEGHWLNRILFYIFLREIAGQALRAPFDFERN